MCPPHVANNIVAVSDVASLIGSIHGALSGLGTPVPVVEEKKESSGLDPGPVEPDHRLPRLRQDVQDAQAPLDERASDDPCRISREVKAAG